MKLENVKVGMLLKDKFGNEYEVIEINRNDDFQPVRVKCVKFVKRVCFKTERDVIYRAGSMAWIPFYDGKSPDSDDVTTKDFMIMRG